MKINVIMNNDVDELELCVLSKYNDELTIFLILDKDYNTLTVSIGDGANDHSHSQAISLDDLTIRFAKKVEKKARENLDKHFNPDYEKIDRLLEVIDGENWADVENQVWIVCDYYDKWDWNLRDLL